jgi:hypothetical protein
MRYFITIGSAKHTSPTNTKTANRPWAWRKTAWEVALCAEGPGFDSCPPHGAFLWGNGIVIVRLAEWPVPLWGLSEG